MEQKLVWGTLGFGVVGWICLALMTLPRRAMAATASAPPQEDSLRRGFLPLSFFLPIVIWLATLPVKAPFSSGQGWGRGFLLGGLLAFGSIFLMSRALSRRALGVRAAATISLFGALIGASIPLLWMRSAVIEALLGGALGWIAVSLVWLLGLNSTPLNSTKNEADAPQNVAATLILNGAAFAASFFVAAALGVYRDFLFPGVARGTYPAVAVALAASVALVFLVDALLGAITSDSHAQTGASFLTPITVGLAFLVPLGVAYLLAMKVLDDLGLFYSVATGVALGALLYLLVREEHGENKPGFARVPITASLVALCGFMLSYQIMQGFGVGLMLLGVWPVTLLALPRFAQSASDSNDGAAKIDIAHTLSLVGAFLGILLISRLFATRFRADLRGVGMDDPFALFGFLAGASVPILLAGLWFETRPQSDSRSLWRIFPTSASLPRLLGLGIFSLAIPGAMLALWGAKIVPAFLLGLALSLVGSGSATFNRIQTSALALWALALAITVSQWTQRFLPLAEVSRAQRLHFLWWSTGSIILLLLIVDYGARLLGWMKNRRAPQTGVPL